MPKQIAITYTCSLCPKNQTPMTEAQVSSFRFEDGGRTFEQFFCQKHLAAVKEGAEPVAVAQEAATTATATSTTGKKGRISDLRKWAAEKKPPIELSSGRQKKDHIDLFEKETGQSYWLD